MIKRFPALSPQPAAAFRFPQGTEGDAGIKKPLRRPERENAGKTEGRKKERAGTNRLGLITRRRYEIGCKGYGREQRILQDYISMGGGKCIVLT
jgi:hypothetical protein